MPSLSHCMRVQLYATGSFQSSSYPFKFGSLCLCGTEQIVMAVSKAEFTSHLHVKYTHAGRWSAAFRARRNPSICGLAGRSRQQLDLFAVDHLAAYQSTPCQMKVERTEAADDDGVENGRVLVRLVLLQSDIVSSFSLSSISGCLTRYR